MEDHLVRKDHQFNGFRQVWTQLPSGVFHGTYTVYWGSGPVVCLHGQHINGRRDGIWTSWRRDGTVNEQALFRDDEEVELRTGPPWLADVQDQQIPD